MRVNPISQNNYYNCTKPVNSPKFEGKHASAKFLGGVFGTMATLGAIAGTVIMSGGVVIPAVLAYGALGAASGAVIGHKIDKNSDKNIDKLA